MNSNSESQEVVVGSGAVPVKPWGKLQNWYRVVAFSVFNGILLFLVLNFLIYVVISARRPAKIEDPLARYGKDNITKAYPGWREEDVKDLVKETYSIGMGLEYEPFTEFRNKPLRGKFVNVDPAGFRLSKDQAPWPPRTKAFNVFIFGASHTFGTGLPDNETIASYLQECAPANHSALPLAVYNFGRVFYISSQELVLFQQLLKAGYVPQVAVFIDGSGDFLLPDGQPAFASRFRRFMARQAGPSLLDTVPVVTAAHWLRDHWRRPKPIKAADDDSSRALLEGVAGRWLANKRMIEVIAGGYGVRPIFVWQPVSTYKYDLAYHFLSGPFVRKLGPNMDPHALLENLSLQGNLGPYRIRWLTDGYALMDDLRAQGRLGPNVLWLADMQQDKHENLYVDAVHYTADFNRIATQSLQPVTEHPNAR